VSTRTCRTSRCPSCKGQTLTGLSDDTLAWSVQVDPVPLSAQGEALALLAGRHTYAAQRHEGRSVRLHQRTRWQIAGTPAGARGLVVFDVYADHRCGAVLPAAAVSHLAPAPRGADSDQPPF